MRRVHLVACAAVLVAALGFARAAEPAGGPAKPPAAAPAAGSAWISGTVVDEDDKPLAGASIDVRRDGSKERFTATSDAKGKFGVRGVPAGPALVTIRLRGRMSETKKVTVPATGVVGVDAKLPPGVRFAGVVKDERDQVVGGAKVVAFHQRENRGSRMSFSYASVGGSAETKADGTYEVDGLAPGESFTLRFVHPRFKPVDLPGLSGEGGGGHDHLEVIFEDAGWVTGVVADAQGRPIAGVRVKGPKDPFAMVGSIFGFEVETGSLGAEERNVTDARGRFLVGCLEGEETRLATEGPNHFPGFVDVTPVVGQETKDVKLILEPATATVGGVVVDDLGAPVPNARVLAYAGRTRAASATTDAQGRFRLLQVKSHDPVTLSASSDGHASGTLEKVALETKTASVTVSRLGRLVMEVLGPDGKRVPTVTITFEAGAKNRTAGGQVQHDQTKGPVDVPLPLGELDVVVGAKGCEDKKIGSYDVEPGQRIDEGKVTLEKGSGPAAGRAGRFPPFEGFDPDDDDDEGD